MHGRRAPCSRAKARPKSCRDYARENSSDDLVVDPHFGAAPLGQGLSAEFSPRALEPEQSDWYVLRGFARRDASGRVPTLKGMPVQIHSDPVIGFALTRDTDHAVGEKTDVAAKLDVATLAANGLDGSGVAIAIVDTGIYLPHLTRQLGAAPSLDVANSWAPPTLTTRAGMHRLGHGTMCAYNALIAAPKATLLDIAMLKARPYGDHGVPATVSAAMQAYWPLLYNWVVAPLLGKQEPPYKSLVISNSWGIFHPSLDPFLPGDSLRFIDNPKHVFRYFTRAFAMAGVDVVFAASNCGPECPSAVCLSKSTGMIMGANAYDEVLTMAGCDVKDVRVAYSSKGPSIADMPSAEAGSHRLHPLPRLTDCDLARLAAGEGTAWQNIRTWLATGLRHFHCVPGRGRLHRGSAHPTPGANDASNFIGGHVPGA